MKKLLAWFLVFALMLALPLVGGMAEEEAVTIVPNDGIIMLSVGRTASIRATVSPRAARNAGLTYESSDEAVATVDSRGRVRGVAEGSCLITLTSNQDPTVQTSVVVNVIIPVRRVTAEASARSVHIGSTVQITPSFTPEDASMPFAMYESNRPQIATVDANGVVTGVARGQATITVRSGDGAAHTSLRITVTQPPESITLSETQVDIVTGRRVQVKATVEPSHTDNKTVLWTSSDESVAKVDRYGRITAVTAGAAIITATCEEDPSIKATVFVNDVQLAKKVAFDQQEYDVILGEQVQLSVTVSPEETTHKDVTYSVHNKHIATVDENGVVTALKGGTTTVNAITADGSRRHASAKLRVIVPVTGVHFDRPDVRVGVSMHGTFTAIMEPEDASNTHMTWTSADESIATVSGDQNRVRIVGHRWGRTTVTGTTEDGGYTCSVAVNIGSLRHAVRVTSIEIRDGKPRIVLKNHSNMNITNIYYEMTGTDSQGNPVAMSTHGDTHILTGEYHHTLTPGESTHHGSFYFNHPSNYPDLQHIEIAIKGWDTDTGYYNNEGELEYSYTISESRREWVAADNAG